MGCLKESSSPQKKVLITWEHEEILFIEKHGDRTDVVLVNPSICTSGMLHPPEAFTIQFNKLKLVLEKCQQGELSFSDFLKKIGQQVEEKYFSLFDKIQFIFS